MSLRNYGKNEKSGSYRGAGAYSKDYATFDRQLTEYSAQTHEDIFSVGDYETDRAFTGEVSRAKKGDVYKSGSRFPRYSDRYTNRGDGKYSPTNDGSWASERLRDSRGRWNPGEKPSVGRQKYSGGSDPFDY